MLDDREDDVVQEARQVLSRLVKQDFGPKPGDSKESRIKAVKAWSSWWKQQLGSPLCSGSSMRR